MTNNSKGLTPITDEELNMLEKRWEEYLKDSASVKKWEEVKANVLKKCNK